MAVKYIINETTEINKELVWLEVFATKKWRHPGRKRTGLRGGLLLYLAAGAAGKLNRVTETVPLRATRPGTVGKTARSGMGLGADRLLYLAAKS